MKVTEPKGTAKQELVGIVISGTHAPPRTTVFSAYVWGLAPMAADEEPTAD